MMLKKITAALLFLIPISAAAQVPTSQMIEQTDAAMAKLEFLVGNWDGEGWISRGPDQRSQFLQTERIQSLLGGSVLLIEGRGVSDEDASLVIHEAVAVLSYDFSTGQYAMRAFIAGGRQVDSRVDVHARTLVWQIGEATRYTININEAGQWHEIGEYSRDGGENWFQFLEMRLSHVK